METIETKSVSETVQQGTVEVKQSSFFTPKTKILIGIVGGLLILLTLTFFKLGTSRRIGPPSAQTTLPTQISSPPVRPVSEFAKTDIFSRFEVKLFDLKSHIDQLDMTETQLTFPLLEMNVNYEK